MKRSLFVVAVCACGLGLVGWEQAFGQASGVANVTFRWTARGGTAHVMKRTWTTGVEDDSPFGTEPAGTGFTNQFGINVFTGTDLTLFDSQTEFRGDVQAYLGDAAGAGPYWAKIGSTTANAYSIEWPLPSGTTFNVADPPGSGNLTYTVDNTTTSGAALGMLQAFDFMRRYYRDTHTLNIPSVPIVWNSGIAGSAYYNAPTFVPERIEIGATSWASWDVLMHEYGHHIANYNNYDGQFGGGHNFGQEVINIATPAPGSRLAYGEGVGTFLGLLAVKDGNLSAAIPGLPAKDYDTFYDSFNTPFNASSQPDNTNIGHRVNAEAKGGANDTGASGPNLGEGDEMSVLRVLWDVYDSEFDTYQTGFDDAVEFGAAGTLGLMTGADIFEDFWDNLANATLADPTKVGLTAGDPSPLILSRLGETLEEYNIGMKPLDDFVSTPDRTPKLRFIEQNDDRSGDMKFMVWNDDFSQLVDNLPFDDTAGLNTWEWDVTVPLTNGTYYWTALANSAIDLGVRPPGGDHREWYWASMHTFTVIPEPSAVILFFTGILSIAGLLHRPRRTA